MDNLRKSPIVWWRIWRDITDGDPWEHGFLPYQDETERRSGASPTVSHDPEYVMTHFLLRRATSINPQTGTPTLTRWDDVWPVYRPTMPYDDFMAIRLASAS